MVIKQKTLEQRLKRILLKVQKPGRYVGGEFNQVKKDWKMIHFEVDLVFPDIYDLGLPNLGLMILYDQINQRKDALAERTYAPAPDMEAEMRKNKIPLYSLESKRPLNQFNLIGFTLPYETLYTNALNLLDLAQIPLFSNRRNITHPIIIAGGHAVSNPEPMAPFFDAIVIGEGEEIIHEIIDFLILNTPIQKSRFETLRELSLIPGVYIPILFHPKYYSDGRIQQFGLDNNKPSIVTKRIVSKLPPPTTRILVPLIDIVHNRVAIEIMRGCTRGCRFCHAGYATRPVRERPVDEIVTGIDNALKATGYDEIALLSLSSSDYTHINELICAISERYAGKNLTISLPSLRIESLSVKLLETLKSSRKGGFTLAPEAATEKIRNKINKPIADATLLNVAEEIYARGWHTLKLYFMIGLPGETLDDIKAIAALSRQVYAIGKKSMGGRASLHIGVSTFVPKPHTPFQWLPLDSLENIEIKQKLLRDNLRGPGIKVTWTDPKITQLEAFLSRGDRRLSQVIYQAWKLGAKFDAWQEHFNFDLWRKSFLKTGLSPDFYTSRSREFDEIFPWENISLGVTKAFLWKDYQWSLQGRTRQDCRTHCFGCGINSELGYLRNHYQLSDWKCPELVPNED